MLTHGTIARLAKRLDAIAPANVGLDDDTAPSGLAAIARPFRDRAIASGEPIGDWGKALMYATDDELLTMRRLYEDHARRDTVAEAKPCA